MEKLIAYEMKFGENPLANILKCIGSLGFFVTIVNSFQAVTIATKNFILDKFILWIFSFWKHKSSYENFWKIPVLNCYLKELHFRYTGILDLPSDIRKLLTIGLGWKQIKGI